MATNPLEPDGPLTIRYELDELGFHRPDLPEIGMAGERVGVAMPEDGIPGGALVAPERAVTLGLELVRLGRALQAAEAGAIVGRP